MPGDVVKALQELGVRLSKVDGDEAVGWCPAHRERTGKEDSHPSWGVNLETGMHNCFSCGFRGPFIRLARYMLGVSDEETHAWIRSRGSIDRAKRVFGLTEQYAKPNAAEVTEADLALYTEVPEWACRERDLLPGSVDHYGFLWDPEHDRWITPVRDPFTNRLIGWQEKGKGYFSNQPKSMEKSHYLVGFRQAVDSGTDTCVMVESPLDVPALHGAFIDGGVSTMGVHVSDEQLDLICQNFRVLVSALDNDKSGRQTNRDLRRRVRGRVLLKFWNYDVTPDAKDPGEQKRAEIAESFRTATNSILARW